MVGGTRSTQQTELARLLDLPEPRPPTPIIGLVGIVFLGGGLVFAGLTALFVLALTPLTDPGAVVAELVIAAVAGLLVGALPVLVGWLILQYGEVGGVATAESIRGHTCYRG